MAATERFLNVETLDQAEALITRLRTNLARLGGRDTSFAESLLAGYKKYADRNVGNPMKRLSGAQWYWVNALNERAEAPSEPTTESAEIGAMKGVIRLFDKAKAHLKEPAITLAIRLDEEVRFLKVMPPRKDGKFAGPAGAINVFFEGKWLGRVLVSGDFQISKRQTDMGRAIVPALRAFAEDPITGAKESARLTGRCCFCHTKLKDERSTEVGYGPICAAHYHLPWGEDGVPSPRKRGAQATLPTLPLAPAPAPVPLCADTGVALDSFIPWPNGAGHTPCTERYAALVDEQRGLTADDNRYHDIEHTLHDLREGGHVGESVRYDRPQVSIALLAGAALRRRADGLFTVEGFENDPISITDLSVLDYGKPTA